MSKENFGDLLKEVRHIRRMTQEQLAENICSRRQLIRIEKGEYEPSSHVITLLSQRLNFDLQKCYQNFKFSKTAMAYELKTSLMYYISLHDSVSIKPLIHQMENLPEFMEGENLQFLFYARSIYTYYQKKDYDLAFQYTLSGIKIENVDFSIDKMEIRNYSNIGLSLLNFMGCILNSSDKTDISCRLFKHLVAILDNRPQISYSAFYQYSELEKTLYQTTAYNLSTAYVRRSDYETALVYADKGIDFAIRHNTIERLPALLQRKFCILCLMNRHRDAIEIYQSCHALAVLTKDQALLESLESDYMEFFPDAISGPL